MYKLLLKSIVALLVLFNSSVVTSQEDNPFGSAKINLTYENKLRFEWPFYMSENYFKKQDIYANIRRTNNYSNIILNYLDEIGFEAQANMPLDIDIVRMYNTSIMHIYRNRRPVTYHMKGDSVLLFHGLHKIRLVETGEQDILIYFDEVEDLKNLIFVDFDNIYKKLKDYKMDKQSRDKNIKRVSDIYYTYINEEIIHTGILGYMSKKQFNFFNFGIGVSYINERLLINFSPHFSLERFSVDNLGNKFIASKTEFGYSEIFGKNLRDVKFFVNYLLPTSFKGNEMVGLGVGLYGLTVTENIEEVSKTFLSLGLIYEKKPFRLSFDYLLKHRLFSNEGSSQVPFVLTAGFHF